MVLFYIYAAKKTYDQSGGLVLQQAEDFRTEDSVLSDFKCVEILSPEVALRRANHVVRVGGV